MSPFFTGEVSMSRRKCATNKVRAWIADARVKVDEVQKIQTQFEHDVTVSPLGDGSVAIYPAWNGNRALFDLFMIKTGLFTEAKIDVNKI